MVHATHALIHILIRPPNATFLCAPTRAALHMRIECDGLTCYSIYKIIGDIFPDTATRNMLIYAYVDWSDIGFDRNLKIFCILNNSIGARVKELISDSYELPTTSDSFSLVFMGIRLRFLDLESNKNSVKYDRIPQDRCYALFFFYCQGRTSPL